MTLRTPGIALITALTVAGATPPALRRQLAAIAAESGGKVAVACSLPGSKFGCDLNPRARPPMQSVFKLPLVITALHRVEQGAFTLDQPVRFLPSDRILPQTYSPLQDKYPEAGVDVPLRELMRLAASLSDNAAADILLRVLGGPAEVETYVHSLEGAGFRLQDSEAANHRDASLQYRNWWQPAAAVRLLRRLKERSPLDADHTRLLFTWIGESPTGPQRIRGRLPAGTKVAHKTGTSGTHEGLTAATNDIGLITLPDGRSLAIAVFVTDSKADEPAREATIARIAEAAYKAAIAAR